MDVQEAMEVTGEVEDDLNPVPECIESMVESLLTQLADCMRTPPEERLEREKSRISIPLIDRTKNVNKGDTPYKHITYPRKASKGSLRPFVQLFRVLDIMHEAVLEDVPVTKRDVYYRDVDLFGKQKVVDNLVDDIAATFDLQRSDLNIRASSKGLICGSSLEIELTSGEVLSVKDTEASLIPMSEDIELFSLSETVDWVLIVEKDAVFQTLCQWNLTNHPELPGRGLMITGKGYPDVATRQLVKALSDNLSTSVPIMALVDGDPYGLDIMSVYKNGSKSLTHENSSLAAPRVQWLGVRASELSGLGVDRDSLLHVTKHDEKKALSMLRRPSGTMPQDWRKELMHMLHARRKAEIEILGTQETNISTGSFSSGSLMLRYLTTKISAIVTSALSVENAQCE